jgi:hypothetical protein
VTRTTRRNDYRSLADADENAIKKEGAVEGAAPTKDGKNEPTGGEQPTSGDTRSGRRSLRSTDTGSRCKSELAQYFHNYEQIISLDAPEPGRLIVPGTGLSAWLTFDIIQSSSLPKPP